MGQKMNSATYLPMVDMNTAPGSVKASLEEQLEIMLRMGFKMNDLVILYNSNDYQIQPCNHQWRRDTRLKKYHPNTTKICNNCQNTQ